MGNVSITVGQFVELLLTKEKYCDLSLPRITAAWRRLINERLVYYEQFRKRYAANLEVLERFEEPKGGVQVEVCDEDGVWSAGVTIGARSSGRQRVIVPVRLASGEVQDVSIGMIIAPDNSRPSGSGRAIDLTRSKGKSNKELLEEFRNSQRDAAVASGKDYCKSSGRHTIHAGGVTFVCGDGDRKQQQRDSDSDEEADR